MAVSRDEFIDKWADRVTPALGEAGSKTSIVRAVREFVDDLDSVISAERAKERRNAAGRKKGQQELAGT